MLSVIMLSVVIVSVVVPSSKHIWPSLLHHTSSNAKIVLGKLGQEILTERKISVHLASSFKQLFLKKVNNSYKIKMSLSELVSTRRSTVLSFPF
jgi:hypothetical protein